MQRWKFVHWFACIFESEYSTEFFVNKHQDAGNLWHVMESQPIKVSRLFAHEEEPTATSALGDKCLLHLFAAILHTTDQDDTEKGH